MAAGTFAVIAGGGTAGHVLPGLAVARALVGRGHPAESIHVVGSERGIENRLVREEGLPFTALPGRGIQRRLTLANVGAVLGLVAGVVKGVALVRRLRPRVVVVLGGYASVPCTVGAVLWRVPIVVMEQNARAGAANRLAGRFARASAVPFATTDLPRAILTGNPVRPEILSVARPAAVPAARAALDLPVDRTVVAVFSGSLGARRINEAVRDAMASWADRRDLAVRHVIGSRDWDAITGSLPALPPGGLHYQPVRYEDRMDLLLAAADVAVCRAGGTTVAELAEVGLGAILVPLPVAPRDHQTANADALVRAGAAIRIPDGELDGPGLVATLDPLLADPGRLAAMGRAAATLGRPDAAERVADLVERYAREPRG
jgi:UDP-N-acetylglucosamine--N-acetylmuramyl-(pentapeptide) pyrophosphoryl-undecaprenol N-acetylglucosamine transferase